MSRKLVYIDSVEQALNKAYGEGNPLRIGRILNNVSAVDAVEVVRCRDCSRANQYDDGSDNFVCSLGSTKKGSGFCSDGERRRELG